MHLHLGHADLRHVVAGREGEFHALSRRGRIREKQCRAALDLRRVAQLERLEHRVQDVAGHVAQSARAEVPPSAEVPRRVGGVVGAEGGRTDECLPVHRLRNAHVALGTGQTLRPDRTVGEGFDTRHLADLAVPDPLADLADALARRALVTHLRGDLVLGGQLGQQARLVHRVRQRLLDVDVLACGHGLGGNDRVRVVGRGHHHRIGRLEQLVVHAAVVVVFLGCGIALEDVVGVLPVHVAESYDVLALHFLQVGRAAAADADAQNVELVAGSGVAEFLT